MSIFGQSELKLVGLELGKRAAASKKFDTQESLQLYLGKLRSREIAKGYLAFSIDSLINYPDSSIAYCFQGPRYYWGNIYIEGQGDEFKHIHKHSKNLKNQAADTLQLSLSISGLLADFENHGFPFAQIDLNQLEIRDSIVEGALKIHPGPFMRIDSIIIKSKDPIRENYVFNYLNIYPKEVYDERKISLIDDQLSTMPFLRSVKSPELLFSPKGVQLFLFLEEKKASSFDGMLGLQPNSNGDLVWTGNLDLKLVNAIKKGEQLELRWKRLQAQTQDFRLQIAYPYLFNTQLGISGKIEAYRRDTTFSNLRFQAGVLYYMKGQDYLKAFFENRQNNQLSKNSQEDFSLSNIDVKRYGLQLHHQKLDFPMSPRSGALMEAEISAGNRRNSPYSESVVQQNIQYSLSLDYKKYIPAGKRWSLLLRGQGAYLYNDGELYDNEVYRIGGLLSLRGTDEESIFADGYGIATVQWNYHLERSTSVYAFLDQAWYERNKEAYIYDHPYGFGLGFSFSTNSGIFTMNYALGRQFDNPILLKYGKVHFGFVSVF